jgi:hypothetical protein
MNDDKGAFLLIKFYLTDEEDGSESSRESGEESSEYEATPPAAKKQRLLQSAPSGRDCAINLCI